MATHAAGTSGAETKTQAKLAPYALALLNFAALFIGCTLLRALLWWQFGPSEATVSQKLHGLAIGLHLDLFVALVGSLPLLLWFGAAPRRWLDARWHRRLATGAFGLIWTVQIFLFFVEYYFFEEFKSRFNTVAVDYLLYPKEVGTNIWESYPLVLVVCLSVGGGLFLGWTAWKLLGRPAAKTAAWGARWPGLAVGFALTLLLGVTAQPNEARFCEVRLCNELANNGQISFVNAALTRHLEYQAFYRTLPEEEAWRRARAVVAPELSTAAMPASGLQRNISGLDSAPKLNVVLLIEESLGSEFWGTLGAGYAGFTNSFTPCMDELALHEGLLFTNLYATGNRTIRGLEGVLASFPPLPGDSIVARDHSEHVETIASVLQASGYETLFLYGGRSLFDNMGKFTLQNGYQRFIEQKDFATPTFTTSWGVCDENVFDRLLVECRALHQAGKPFLATTLSVSNHKPYTYPVGRIPEDPNKHWRHHAVKYADYALGRFFKCAKNEPFYTNTVFVVVADHGARVYGRQTIPMESYRIPLLIVGPAAVRAPQQNGVLGCSLDVAPTVLGLMGLAYPSVFFGQDLCQIKPEQGRALVQHNRDIGMVRNNHMVVLGLQKTIEYYHRNHLSGEFERIMQPGLEDRELAGDAMAIYQIADELYVNRQYWAHREPAIPVISGRR